jgi:GlcNAc-PI de-N-acetylase
MKVAGPGGSRAGRAGTILPAWPSAPVVIAHPDDESFGLGAAIDQLTAAGAAAHILCYTRGGASTLNQTQADLHRAREAGLCQIDLCVRISRQRQRRAALLHASQISPSAVLWRRLQLLGECEHLRWLVPPAAAITSSSLP